MVRRIAAVAAMALLLALVPAGGAAASTAGVSGGILSYSALPGEANDLAVTLTAGTATVTDAPGITIGVTPGCTNPESDNTATCAGVTDSYTVTLGDQTDFLNMTGVDLPNVSTIHGGDDAGDLLRGGPGPENIFGDAGDDQMLGGAGQDFFFGGSGFDFTDYSDHSAPVTADLNGNVADDGAAGESDKADADDNVEGLLGGTGGNVLTGDAGDNQLNAGGGGQSNSLMGLGGRDFLLGGSGPDAMAGGTENDVLLASDQAASGDVYDGGPGTDQLQYNGRSTAVTLDIADPGPDGSAGESDTVTTMEGAGGGSGDDRLIGNAAAGPFAGGAGSDFIDGGGGADVMAGGAGNDTVSYASRTADVTANLVGGITADDGEANELDNISVDVENLEGGSGNDSLTGNALANALTGGAGNDTVTGAGSGDAIDGGAGTDNISGGDGPDQVTGGADADTIDAGAGDDSLRVRDGVADTVACGDGLDLALTDPVDALTACESFDDGQPPPQGQPPDTTPPVLTLGTVPKRMKRKAFLGGVKLRAGCNEACTLLVELRATPRSGVRLARNELTLGTRSAGLSAARRTLTVKPSRKLVGKARKFKVQLRITAVDAARNSRVATRTIAVR